VLVGVRMTLMVSSVGMWGLTDISLHPFYMNILGKGVLDRILIAELQEVLDTLEHSF